MKIFMYNDTIVNLAEVTHISHLNLGYGKSQLRFHFTTGKDVSIDCKTEAVTNLLRICYETMIDKGE